MVLPSHVGEILHPKIIKFLALLLVAIAATLAARLDFDVFIAIFWRFYLFSGQPLGCWEELNKKLLNAIYEQDFMDFSNGYRSNRGAKEAVGYLAFNLQYGSYGYVVEADIKGFFDNLGHEQLLEMLAQRIDDQPFLNLIRKWLKAGILDTDGTVLDPEAGTPQGGVISPPSSSPACGIQMWYVLLMHGN